MTDFTDEIFDTVGAATRALYPEARIPETPMPQKPREEWRPIETAPKDGSRFLYAWRDPDDGVWTIAVGFYSSPTDREVGPITHWMPLPNPPCDA